MIYVRIKTDSDVELMHAILRSAISDIFYYEQELIRASRKHAAAKALLVRCGCDYSIEQAIQYYHDQDDGDDLRTANDYLKYYIGELGHGSDHYHSELANAHKKLAAAQIMLARGNYEEISFDEVRAEVKKQREQREQEQD